MPGKMSADARQRAEGLKRGTWTVTAETMERDKQPRSGLRRNRSDADQASSLLLIVTVFGPPAAAVLRLCFACSHATPSTKLVIRVGLPFLREEGGLSAIKKCHDTTNNHKNTKSSTEKAAPRRAISSAAEVSVSIGK